MKWEQEPPPEHLQSYKIEQRGPCNIVLSVGESDGEPNKTWQYLMVSFGKHTTRPRSECLHEWPREALEKVRQALDEFEEQLDEAKQAEREEQEEAADREQAEIRASDEIDYQKWRAS